MGLLSINLIANLIIGIFKAISILSVMNIINDQIRKNVLYLATISCFTDFLKNTIITTSS